MPPFVKGQDVRERLSNPNFQFGLAAGALIGVMGGLAGHRVYARYFRRIQNSDWITPDILAKKRRIKGVVTESVGWTFLSVL